MTTQTDINGAAGTDFGPYLQQAPVNGFEEQIREKDQKIQALKARVVELARQVFGPRTQKTSDATPADHDPAQEPADARRCRAAWPCCACIAMV